MLKIRWFHLLSMLVLIDPELSKASLGDRNYEFVLGSETTSINPVSINISDHSNFHVNGLAGVFVDAYFEVTLALHSSHYSPDVDHDQRVRTSFDIGPGLTYNLTEDYKDTWAIHLSVPFRLFSGGSDYGSIGPAMSGLVSVGRRIQISDYFSWYPKIVMELEPENKSNKTHASLDIRVIPLSLSMWF